MTESTSANGANGAAHESDHLPDGRFAPGNQAAHGRANPHAAKITQLRTAWLAAITTQHLHNAATALANKSQDGDVRACRELLTRTIGAPIPADVMERLDFLEQALQQFLTAQEARRQ